MEILNTRLPENPFLDRLPGTRPVEADTWLKMDEVYAQQMSYRDQLIAERRDTVYRCDAGAEPAAQEVLERVVELIRAMPGFEVSKDTVTRPDGVTVDLHAEPPLITAGRLVQEDLCILEKPSGDEHVLTAGLLCFPASWSLDEKHMRSMSSIHVPVVDYDDRIGRGVQRMFDMLRPGTVLCRGNLLGYFDPELFTPRRENERRERPQTGRAPFLRAERQCLLVLPNTKAILFSIHSYVVKTDDLESDQADLVSAALPRALR